MKNQSELDLKFMIYVLAKTCFVNVPVNVICLTVSVIGLVKADCDTQL